jgi:ketosteroid isomerase-like protein
MDRDTAQAWLDRYVAAWLTYDPAAIGDLFSEDVSYRYHPYDEPITGRDDVVASWLGQGDDAGASTRDAPGTYEASYAPYAIDGDAVVATGTSSYRDAPGGPVARVFHNCFVLRFDAEGRCREFTEFYVRARRD